MRGVGVFAWWELRVAHPMFEVRLFTGHRVFAFSCLAALVHYSATFGVTFLMSLYLQYIKGLSPQEAGTVLIAQPVMMALFSPLAGRLSDRIEPRVLSSLGMAITAGGAADAVPRGRGHGHGVHHPVPRRSWGSGSGSSPRPT